MRGRFESREVVEMQVEIEESGPFIRKLSVTLPCQEVNQAIDAAYRQVAKKARIPGFRPGKAPRGVLEMHYGPQVNSDVYDRLVNQSLPKAMLDNQISPVATPRIMPGDLKKGLDFSYTAEVEIQPEIELASYEGLEVVEVDMKVDDSEIEAELERLRQQSSQIVPVSGRDIVEDGDLVQMDYEGFLDGALFDGGKAENAMIEVGAGNYLKGFEDGVLGAKVPGDIEFPVDFPETYQAEELAGKQAIFKATLKELKMKELPELDDDLAVDLGHENLDGLKAKVLEDITARKKESVRQEERTHALKALVEANPCEVAPSMVEEQIDRMLQGAAMQMQQMMGIMPDLASDEMQSLRENSRENAVEQVRSGLLLMEVAKAAEVEVSPEDLDAEVERIMQSAGANAPQVKAHFSKPEEMTRLRYRLLEDKTIDMLLDKAVRVPAPEETPADDAVES